MLPCPFILLLLPCRCHVTLPLCAPASLLVLAHLTTKFLLVCSCGIPSERIFPEAAVPFSCQSGALARLRVRLCVMLLSPHAASQWRVLRLHSAQPPSCSLFSSRVQGPQAGVGRGRGLHPHILTLASPLHVCRVCLQRPACVTQWSMGTLLCTRALLWGHPQVLLTPGRQ